MPTRLCTVSLLVAALVLPGCWNGSYNSSTSKGGERFQLTIEPSLTDIAGTHFLVDSATGDLWRLEPGSGGAQWVRLADGPGDAADLTPAPPASPDGKPSGS